jgi:hypothetical protein
MKTSRINRRWPSVMPLRSHSASGVAGDCRDLGDDRLSGETLGESAQSASTNSCAGSSCSEVRSRGYRGCRVVRERAGVTVLNGLFECRRTLACLRDAELPSMKGETGERKAPGKIAISNWESREIPGKFYINAGKKCACKNAA